MRTVRFDKVALMSLEASKMNGPWELRAKLGFVSSARGTTHGTTLRLVHSAAVQAKMRELAELIEKEVETSVFTDATVIEKSSKGIAESLAEDEGTSV